MLKLSRTRVGNIPRTWVESKDENILMPIYDKIMLRKRNIMECINELLKNKTNLVHSRHKSIHNFVMNLCSTLTTYCFFDNKPDALPVYVEKTKQLELFKKNLSRIGL